MLNRRDFLKQAALAAMGMFAPRGERVEEVSCQSVWTETEPVESVTTSTEGDGSEIWVTLDRGVTWELESDPEQIERLRTILEQCECGPIGWSVQYGECDTRPECEDCFEFVDDIINTDYIDAQTFHYQAESLEYNDDGSVTWNNCTPVEKGDEEYPILCDAERCPLGIRDGDCPFNQNGFCL